MGYLNKQIEKLSLGDNELLGLVANYFERYPNQKIQVNQIVSGLTIDSDYEHVDEQISTLVSRGLINEFYINDNHFFEYSISSDINTQGLLDEIIAKLKKKNYRITDSRKKLVELFVNMPNKHFSFDELVKLSGKKVNIATMYNNLATLSDEKIINDFYIDDTRMFELSNKSHAHFICESCKTVYNIETEGSNSLDIEVENQYGFEVNTRKIEFTGICLECKRQVMERQAENVNFVNEFEYPGIEEEAILKYINYLQVRTNGNSKGISIVFLPIEEVHKLNNEFRGIDHPTDVLTFVENSDDYLGDVIICYEYIQKQADEYEHSFKRELYFLLTHGYLHLIGYDHLTPDDEKEMFAIQNELLNKYGVSRDE